MRLEDKVAVVTGGGNGIGRAIATLFAAEGAALTVADIEAGSGRGADRGGRRPGVGPRHRHVGSGFRQGSGSGDVGRFRPSGYFDEQRGGVCVRPCRGDYPGGLDRVFGVNVIGYANMVRECSPALRAAGHGAVVNIASISSFVAQPEFIPYNVSKGAVMQLTRCLAMDLAPDNVRVNAICPGDIRTRATDQHIASRGLDPEKAYEDFGKGAVMKRMGRPEEIATVALFLASPDASFMTGAHVVVDGGATLD